MGKLWSHITGKKGTSRVRVYERYADSPLHVEWYLGGQRYQRSLKTETGETIRDKRDAMRIAEAMADALEKNYRSSVRQKLWGVAPGKTVGQLLGAMHKARGPRWSESHRKGQDRFRKFWADKLGADTPLTQVTEPMIESALGEALSDRRPGTRNRYRRYIVDAFTYAQKKLKWIEERHNLSSVDFEDPQSKGRAYTEEEVGRLLKAFAQIDPVAEWIAHTLWQTGRRLTAARTLPKSAVTVEERRTVVRWPAETDKAGKEGASVLKRRAHELSAILMERPGKYMAGTKPASMDVWQKRWLPEAERIAGIEHIKGRGIHGAKRRFAGTSKGLKGRDRQSGTLERTLTGIYEPDDDLDAKEEVADALAQRIEGR